MYESYFIHRIVIISILIVFTGCREGNVDKKLVHHSQIEKVTAKAWENLSKKKIYFGHQSVGNNIMEGVLDVVKQNKINLKIKETTVLKKEKNGVFAHSKVGKNKDPQSKISDFERIIVNDVGNVADIAFLKLCFVDIDQNTDLEKTFEAYTRAIENLENKYKDTQFVHLTVPLIKRSPPNFLSKFKRFIKSIMRKNIDSFFDDENNMARNRYNDLLLKKYLGKKPIFDLARIESTRADGTRETFEKFGKTYYALVPEYTEDAGHLYGYGREKVAEALLLFLVNIQD